MGLDGFDMTKDGNSSSYDAFVTMINPAGALAWTSYLGGTGVDIGRAIVADMAGNVYVYGDTSTGGWAIGGFDTSYNGGVTDMFLAKINEAIAPAVTATALNGNAVQRSTVKKLSVTFGEPVAVSSGGLALLSRSGGAVPDVTIDVANPLGDKRTWELTFSGDAVVDGSLPDGLYSLVVSPSQIRDLAGNQLAAGSTTSFHRLFGDADGDRDVDSTDLALFRKSLNRPSAFNPLFDYNGDGKVNSTDYHQLKLRLTRSVLL